MSQTELNRRRIMAAISGSDYEAVDLGLPSGKKWATVNVGATKPEEDGLYFSWGNTEGYSADGYPFSDAIYKSTQGYSISSDLTLEQDAANVMWGGKWRMPTKVECEELKDNTDSEWVADYEGTGVAGRKFMKKTDHSVFIFIPASGRGTNNSLIDKGATGFLRTSTYVSSTSASILKFTTSSPSIDAIMRYMGLTIRPIMSV